MLRNSALQVVSHATRSIRSSLNRYLSTAAGTTKADAVLKSSPTKDKQWPAPTKPLESGTPRVSPTKPLVPGTPKVIIQSPSNFNINFMASSRNPPHLSSRRANCSAFTAHLKHVHNFEASMRPSFIPLPVLPETHKRSSLRPPDHTREIRVVMIRTKKRIPGGAVVRNRTSRRVFEAFKTCIQRRNMARQLLAHAGAVLVLIPTKEAYERPMDLLVEDAKEALTFLNLGDTNQKQSSSSNRQHSKRPPARNSSTPKPARPGPARTKG
ncbi:unnamed protein product [Sympodiomycopsis kandeliae]